MGPWNKETPISQASNQLSVRIQTLDMTVIINLLIWLPKNNPKYLSFLMIHQIFVKYGGLKIESTPSIY